MPIYEYVCESCCNTEEVLQKMNEKTWAGKCVQCGAEIWHRIVSKSDFHLKGGGWYKDGYQKNPQSSD